MPADRAFSLRRNYQKCRFECPSNQNQNGSISGSNKMLKAGLRGVVPEVARRWIAAHNAREGATLVNPKKVGF
jgi:hypothetical protein